MSAATRRDLYSYDSASTRGLTSIRALTDGHQAWKRFPMVYINNEHPFPYNGSNKRIQRKRKKTVESAFIYKEKSICISRIFESLILNIEFVVKIICNMQMPMIQRLGITRFFSS